MNNSIIGLFLLFILFLIWKLGNMFYKIGQLKKYNIPFTQGTLLTGNISEIFTQAQGWNNFLKWKGEYGKMYIWNLGLVGASASVPGYVVLTDPADGQKALSISTSTGATREAIRTDPEPPLFFQNGDRWKQTRNFENPSFNGSAIRSYYSGMKKVTEILLEKIEQKEGHPIEADELFSNYALDIIGESAFGEDFGALRGESLYVKLIQQWMQALQTMMANPFAKYLSTGARAREARAPVQKFAMQKITDRKKNNVQNDLLGNLIRAQQANPDILKDENLKLELEGYISAGHETTGHTLAWIVFFLARYPEVQKKAYQQVEELCPQSDEIPTNEQLSKMSYITAIIKEALRLKGPANIGVTRLLSKPTEFSGIRLDEGTPVFIPFASYHSDPEYWGEDVKQFKPDRFLTTTTKNPAFIPFSAGARSCIGQHFAMFEMQLCISSLLKRFCWKMKTDREIDLKFEFTLKPSVPIEVIFDHR